MNFAPATSRSFPLRLALIGPSGSGKSFTALAIATALGQRVAVIDSERGSSVRYARAFPREFCSLDLPDFAPATYVQALYAAHQGGFDVVIVDSLSHAWMGRGGALEMVDQAAKRSKGGSSFNAWREVTPEHNKLVEALVGAPFHLIVTMRVKTEYVIEQDSRGKSVPRKVGLAPVQRDGLEYEFDIVGDLSPEHDLVVTKSRCPVLTDAVINKPGAQLAETLRLWTSGQLQVPAAVGGGYQTAPAAQPAAQPAAEQEQAEAAAAPLPSSLAKLTHLLAEATTVDAVKKAGGQWDQWAKKQGPELAELVKEGYARITARARELQSA